MRLAWCWSHGRREIIAATPKAGSPIADAILARIAGANVCVCLISSRTRASKWVNWELERCRLAQKAIVGLVLKDAGLTTLAACPYFFTRHPEYKVVPWGTPADLQRAIDRAVSDVYGVLRRW